MQTFAICAMKLDLGIHKICKSNGFLIVTKREVNFDLGTLTKHTMTLDLCASTYSHEVGYEGIHETCSEVPSVDIYNTLLAEVGNVWA